MKMITVTRRTDDYHACIDGKPGYWDCGKTPTEAIGALVQTHPEQFSIEIEICDSRKITIKLKANQSGIGAEYRVDLLKNAEHVWAKGTALRVGSEVTQQQANELCNVKEYEVTITV